VVLGERGDQWLNVHLASVPRWGTVELFAVQWDDGRRLDLLPGDRFRAIGRPTRVVEEHDRVGPKPEGITINQAGTRIYVAANGSVSVIDTSTNTVTAVIAGFGSGGASNVALSPDGARLYVTNNSGGFMSVIDTATNTVSGNGPAGPFPFGLALNPAGTRAYITNVEFDVGTDPSAVIPTPIPVAVTVLDLTTTVGP
jgi:YVTN family beta-propeller protein